MENSISTAEFHLHTEEESTSSGSLPHHPPPQMSNGKEKSEEITLVEEAEAEQSRRPNLLSLQIPTRPIETTFSNSPRKDGSSLPSPSSTRAGGLPPRPSSVKFKSMRNLLPQRSFRAKNVVHQDDVEETVLIVPDTLPSDGPLRSTPRQPQRSFSLNKLLFTSSNKTTHSSPVTPIANSGPVLSQERDLDGHSNFPRVQVSQHMTRSFSVPVNVKTRSVRRMDSMGGVIRVIPASPRPAAVDADSPNNASVAEIVTEDAGEDILEEEAVCRICLVELAEGGDAFRLECSCKGELALSHQECAVKWFSIKGNKSCDVCKQDVRNLPVTLLKIQNPQTVIRRPPNIPQQREVTRYRVWQDVPVLVMVSMLAYFCFLEQLLVSNLGPRALAISLPFSCVLGLLSSMIASTLVSKGYLWAFACFQFALVILFAHIFYSILNVNSILSVLLSSFTGFGISISTNSLLVEYLRWRRNRDLQSSLQHGNIDVLPQYYHHQQRQHQQPQEHQQEHRQPQQHHQHNQQQILENSNMEPANSSMQQQETRAHNT